MLLYIFGIISNSKIFKSYGDQFVRYKINNKGMWLSKNIYKKKRRPFQIKECKYIKK